MTVLKEDIEFIMLIMRNWAHYEESEVEALVNNIEDWELTERTLMDDGFNILENMSFVKEELVTLIKVGQGEWVVKDSSDEDMEEFVKILLV